MPAALPTGRGGVGGSPPTTSCRASRGLAPRAAARPATPSPCALLPLAARRRARPHAAAAPPGQEPASPAPPVSAPPPSGGGPLAVGAVALGAVAFIASRLVAGSAGASLADVASGAVPLGAALASGRPTVLEFYADYCEVCVCAWACVLRGQREKGGGGERGPGKPPPCPHQFPCPSTSPPPLQVCKEAAPEALAAQRSPAGAAVNYVLLNVDNARWAPEVAEYGVRGVPHWVFLDGGGRAVGAAVGRLPAGALAADVGALAAGSALPVAGVGTGGEVTPLRAPPPAVTEPRAHG